MAVGARATHILTTIDPTKNFFNYFRLAVRSQELYIYIFRLKIEGNFFNKYIATNAYKNWISAIYANSYGQYVLLAYIYVSS